MNKYNFLLRAICLFLLSYIFGVLVYGYIHKETEIYCYLSDRYVGVTKTRWLENGYSYINTPSDYPLGDINKINEN